MTTPVGRVHRLSYVLPGPLTATGSAPPYANPFRLGVKEPLDDVVHKRRSGEPLAPEARLRWSSGNAPASMSGGHLAHS